MDSILNTVKTSLSLAEDYHPFDNELVILINSLLPSLIQNGIGKKGFQITGPAETWTDFIGSDTDINEIKTYLSLRVRMLFDPPTNTQAMDAMKQASDEWLWRSRIQVETVRPNDL